MESARSSLGRSLTRSLGDVGEVVKRESRETDVLRSGGVRGGGNGEDEGIEDAAKEDLKQVISRTFVEDGADATQSFVNLRTQVNALMNEQPDTDLASRPSFDVRKERDLSTQIRPDPAPVPSAAVTPGGFRASTFKEELVIDEEDVADFERWKEMKRLDDQRYDTNQAINSDPRSPLELPSTPMSSITNLTSTDSLPRRLLRKIGSIGSSQSNSAEEGASSPRKRQSASSLLRKVTSLGCMSNQDDDFGGAPVLQQRQSGSNLAFAYSLVRMTADMPPIRSQRPARSPLDLHVGRMVFEDDNPFAYVECQSLMDDFRGLKRWSWYNKPGLRSFNMDPDWDNAKKELDRVNAVDDQILSIIAEYEDMPEFDELIQEIENKVAATEERLRMDSGTNSPNMSIDLNNAPMVLRHLEQYRENSLGSMLGPRVLGSIGSGDEVDVPVMLEEDYSDDSDEGGGGRSFDCAEALNGQMTFLISDSEDEGVEEDAVMGAYAGHRSYSSGEVVRVWVMDAMEGAFF